MSSQDNILAPQQADQFFFAKPIHGAAYLPSKKITKQVSRMVASTDKLRPGNLVQ